MKNTTTIYWIVTGIFAAFMISTSIPNIMVAEDSIKFITGLLGYPEYLIPFIGVAKVAGSIVILLPGLNRIKEWAYAGLFFDLAGATFSVIMKVPIEPSIIFMILPIVFLFASYYLWHKKMAIA
jgi:hypothetical protein